MTPDFRDRCAVVTGASSGIGRAIALALGAQGARLCLVARDVRRMREVARAVLATAPEPACLRADLANDAQVEALGPRILQALPGVDILVHAAGVIAVGGVDMTPPVELDRAYRVHLRAPYVITRALLPSLRDRRGEVVLVNSSAVLHASAGITAYAATKNALRALADGLREEVNPAGLRVLTLLPGRTATPMQEQIHAAEGRAWHPELLMQPEDVAAVALHALSLPRTVEVTEIRMRPMLRSY